MIISPQGIPLEVKITVPCLSSSEQLPFWGSRHPLNERLPADNRMEIGEESFIHRGTRFRKPPHAAISLTHQSIGVYKQNYRGIPIRVHLSDRRAE